VDSDAVALIERAMHWSGSGTRLFAYTTVMTVFAAVTVALRFVSRGRILRVLGPSDWFLAVTLVGTPSTPVRTCD
jgi:hypothetical protein